MIARRVESPCCLIIRIGQNCPKIRQCHIIRAKWPVNQWLGRKVNKKYPLLIKGSRAMQNVRNTIATWIESYFTMDSPSNGAIRIVAINILISLNTSANYAKLKEG